MKRLVLIDGNAIMHRAFHALPPLINSAGIQTNAVYGFVSILLRVIEELKPSHLIVTFDRPKPTFRKQLFKEYQAHRPAMDNQLVPQIALIHKVVDAMRIPVFEKDGFEADDVIGTLSRSAPKKGIDEVVVVTGDRDLLQLIDDNVKLYMPIKGLSEAKLFGAKEAEERMGVPPSQIADLKGLMGDPSDNYPGVAGVGPKTAVTLLKQFGTVESIYKNLNKISNPALVAKLTVGKENALMSHKLATVVRDVPLECDFDKALTHDYLTHEVIDTFGELGFKTLLKRLSDMTRGKTVEVKVEKKQVVSKTQMELF